jgi:hypothetical protein
MGMRSEPRKDIEVPVRIFGTDKTGAVFSQKAITVNVSRNGVELTAVTYQLAVDEIVGLSYGSNRVHFRVKWVGSEGTPKAGRVGLLNISPGKPLWDFPLDASCPDPYQPGAIERRKNPRYRCQLSTEIHIQNGPSFWGNLADLSLGGCYVEMPLPIETGKKLKMALWLGEDRIWAQGEVAHRTPGFGVGVRFTEVAEADRERLRVYLDALAPLLRKPPRGAAHRVQR